jgi:hypothetical protein
MTCTVGGSQSSSNTCPTPQAQTPQEPADAAVSEIRGVMEDGGWAQDNITHDELVGVKSSLESLSPPDANDAISQLTDEELSTIAGEIDSTGLGNSNGLSYSEKDALIGNLAGKLNATQFGRLAAAFDDPQPIAESVANSDNTDAKIGFIDAYDENTTDPDAARAIGTVLGSMGGDQEGLNRIVGHGGILSGDITSRNAVDTISDKLQNVLDASLDTTAIGTEGGAVFSFKPSGLNDILDAVSTSHDPAIKGNLFRAAANSLSETQNFDAGNVLAPATSDGSAATAITEHMTSLLQTDTPGITSYLETFDPTNQITPIWTSQMLADGKANQLNSILIELRGPPQSDYLVDPEVAQDFGYMLGGVGVGLEKLKMSAQENADQLRDVLGLGIGRIPGGVGSAVNTAIRPLFTPDLGEQQLGLNPIKTEDISSRLYGLLTFGMPAEVQGGAFGEANGRAFNYNP